MKSIIYYLLKYHILLAQVSYITCSSIIYYFDKYHILLFSVVYRFMNAAWIKSVMDTIKAYEDEILIHSMPRPTNASAESLNSKLSNV